MKPHFRQGLLATAGLLLTTFLLADGGRAQTAPERAVVAPAASTAAATWLTLDSGHWSSCGIKADRTLWCWGDDPFRSGRLDSAQDFCPDQFGCASLPNAPRQVGASSSWKSVSTGGSHTCALKTTETLWCWGGNASGQLGDGTRTSRKGPGQVGTERWERVSASPDGEELDGHTCAVRSDRTLWCWGENRFGQLGDGTTSDRVNPRRVGTGRDWTRVGTTSGHTCAIKTDRTLWCWGRTTLPNRDDPPSRLVPQQLGTAANWVSIDPGGTCGIRADHTLWCGSTSSLGTPFRKVDRAENWASVDATGLDHTCAIKTNQTLWCWGENYEGQLGDGTVTDREAPRKVSGDSNDWSTVAIGWDFGCAIKIDRKLWCWGDNHAGQLGDGTSTEGRPRPHQIGTASNWIELDAKDSHSCGIRSNRTLWCWGLNEDGQLGDGTNASRFVPTQIGAASDWSTVGVGGDHTCATKADNTLWCWGWNKYGQVGDGTTRDGNTPRQIGTAATWAKVEAGTLHTCATKSDDTLWCWGRNREAQLGDGTLTNRTAPQQIGSATTWATLSVDDHTCATRTDHSLWCWGSDVDGQLGDGDEVANVRTPYRVGTDADWATAGVGGYRTCAIKTDRTLWCWGSDYDHAGTGEGHTSNERPSPLQVGTARTWTAVSMHLYHTCATRTDNTLRCWGANETYEIGDGTTTPRPSPLKIGGADWATVRAGNVHTCALKTDRTLWCWGTNLWGQLGDGSELYRVTPARLNE